MARLVSPLKMPGTAHFPFPRLKDMHIFSHHEYEQKIRRSPFMSKAKSFITGVICGGAVAGLAVLFSTPSSGKRHARQVKRKRK